MRLRNPGDSPENVIFHDDKLRALVNDGGSRVGKRLDIEKEQRIPVFQKKEPGGTVRPRAQRKYTQKKESVSSNER